jgi:hypothetical protein
MTNYPDDYRFPPAHDERCEENGEHDCICADLRESDAADEGDRKYQELKDEGRL